MIYFVSSVISEQITDYFLYEDQKFTGIRSGRRKYSILTKLKGEITLYK
ncbi:MAG: hypothetical protein IQL11_15520 [Bacteroidales bacterium]|nr:hypothetical protein [Bacteroidales bacterium]